MKRLGIIIISIFAYAQQIVATMPVIDSANLANSARQVASWAKQLQEMKNQLEQAKRQYNALTGSRNLGSILHNPDLQNYFPVDLRAVYDATNAGVNDIDQLVNYVTNIENLTGSIDEMKNKVEVRSKRRAITNKAMTLKGYEGSLLRSKQINNLMQQINSTQDLKAINELQARIAIEQAAIQNESTKLQLISQLQINEQQLIQEQKRDMSRRLLNSNNKQMPRIK